MVLTAVSNKIIRDEKEKSRTNFLSKILSSFRSKTYDNNNNIHIHKTKEDDYKKIDEIIEVHIKHLENKLNLRRNS